MTALPCPQPYKDRLPVTSRVAGRVKRTGLLASLLLLSACASYQPRQLPDAPDLATDPAGLKVDPASLSLPQLKGHILDLTDGLDGIEIAMLAVSNNPRLKAARLKYDVAQAQVFAAGLLPDPQLSASLVHPSGGTGRVNGYDLGLAYDIRKLITRGTDQAAYTATQRQVDLQLLWEEWQVIQKARELTLKLQVSQRKLKLLHQAQTRYEANYQRSRRLLARGDMNLNDAATTATAWADMQRRVQQQQQQADAIRHDLLALLGLSSSARLPLSDLAPPPADELSLTDQLWRRLPQRRPDLLALQAGYRSQEQRVRRAILAQFPALNVGFTRSRDNDGLYTNGLGITLDLPLLSGGRGQIAIERATRERLRAEYQSRLNRTRSDIERLLDRRDLLREQADTLARQRPVLEKLTDSAQRAYDHGDLLALNLFALELALLENRLTTLDLQQSLWQIRIALDTLLAWPQAKDQ